MITLIKQPTAWIPLLMSAVALILLLGYLAYFILSNTPIVHEADEGTTAHLFQLLLAGQLPFVAYFAIKWLPKKLKDALIILILQAIAGVIALAPVFIFGL